MLLIDEIDVFFQKDFFGELYRPEISITSGEVKNLMNYIWREYKRDNKITNAEI